MWYSCVFVVDLTECGHQLLVLLVLLSDNFGFQSLNGLSTLSPHVFEIVPGRYDGSYFL